MLPRSALSLLCVITVLSACDEAPTEPPEDTQLRQLGFTEDFDPVAIPVPEEAACSIHVHNHGDKAMESDYLPNVLACEAPGQATLEMLEAQAIAARSYAYYFAETSGEICNGQGCQVFSCGRTPSELHRKAVENTSGVVLRYNDNLTVGFYVAGDSSPDADCTGNSSGVGNTERYVTYNEGRSSSDIEQTRLGFRHGPSAGDYGQNRGALSQWGAHCLATNRDYGTLDILRYYYGEDIELQQVEGACVGEADIDVDESPAECTALESDGQTILDNGSDCLRLLGPSQYWRTEAGGIGGSLRWTKSTRSAEHNVAVWRCNPQVAGDYRLQVHIEAAYTTGTNAEYEVVSAESSRVVTVDQTEGGWIDLGTFPLDPDAADQQVRMTDAIGITGQVLQVDALRVLPAGATPIDDGVGRADDVGGAPLSGARGADSGGCSVGGSQTGGAWGGLFVLVLLGMRRRL